MADGRLMAPAEPGNITGPTEARGAASVLWLSTAGFTLLFAVWLMFGVLAIPIRKELSLTEMQFSWLTAIAILNGSFWRLCFGILTDRFGGRLMMTLLLAGTAIPAVLVSFARSYSLLLLLAFLVGIAGNGFAIGVAWNSIWFRKQTQGFAPGCVWHRQCGGVGDKTDRAGDDRAGAGGGFCRWMDPRRMAVHSAVVCGAADHHGDADVGVHSRGSAAGEGADAASGAYAAEADACVALRALLRDHVRGVCGVSVWLPHYYQDVYHLSLAVAALLTALFIFPASLLRPLGGYLSDVFGPRRVMYAVFGVMTVTLALLSIPNGTMSFDVAGGGQRAFHVGTGPVLFAILVFVLGVGMGIGKAAVYKYIPEYFPQDVGAVGGLVGTLGGLGGFFLPPMFAWCQGLTSMPQATFGVLLGITAASFAWLHLTVRGMKRRTVARVPEAALEASPLLTA